MPTVRPMPPAGSDDSGAGRGHLAENVMHFARLLRHAGMPVGSDRAATALQALQVAGLDSRTDFHAVLGACLLDRAEHHMLFDRAFDLYWRAPGTAAVSAALSGLWRLRVREPGRCPGLT